MRRGRVLAGVLHLAVILRGIPRIRKWLSLSPPGLTISLVLTRGSVVKEFPYFKWLLQGYKHSPRWIPNAPVRAVISPRDTSYAFYGNM